MHPLVESTPTPPRHSRPRITAHLPLILAALLGMSALTACVEPGDSSEIVSGTSPAKKLTDELAVLRVTLPSDAVQMTWLVADTWDTNDTYVRFTAPRRSVFDFLRQNDIDDSSLMPLSRASDYADVLPEEVLSGIPPQVARPTDLSPWILRDAEKSSAVAFPMDHNLPSVGAIVLDPHGTQPTVILHWHR
jgi:hypothetical protein